jgi:pantetheine hydrolase
MLLTSHKFLSLSLAFNLKEQILNELSEAVANVSIYVLVNIVERSNESADDDISLFNTNIVLNRQGCIISRYRKFNLFVEPHMNSTDEAEISIFETDFGVTFGHFICFDILFRAPALTTINLNVSHILYPSMWYSELPFLTSTQIQQSFAYRNNIVLLSSGTNAPANSNTGSGIFVGRHGAIDSIISYRNESKMIVARVPKDVNEYRPRESAIKPYTPSQMDGLKLWSHLPSSALTYPLREGSIIHEGSLECEFSIDFTRLEHEEDATQYGYRLIAFNGVRNYANTRNGGEIYCAIVACLNETDAMTCGRKFESSEKLVPSVLFHSIKIKASINEDDSDNGHLVMPTSLDFSINPLPTGEFEFTVEDGEVQKYSVESSSELNEILTFGIYGRNFNRDCDQATEDEARDEEMENDAEMFASTLRIDELESLEVEGVYKSKENIRGHGDPNIFLTVSIYVPLMIVLCIIAAILVYRRLKDPYEHPLVIMRRRSEMLTS